MDDSRYLECLSADYGDLRDAASSVELTAPVPSCPGRTVSHLVVHVAEGYLHETAIMRSGQVPEPWPPAGLAAEAPLALLGRGPADRRPRLGGLPPADARRGHQVRVPRLPDPLAGAALAGRRLMQDYGPRPEQELGVGVRRPVGLGQAVAEHQRGGALVRVVDLAEHVVDPVSEPDDPGRPLARGWRTVSVHMYMVPSSGAFWPVAEKPTWCDILPMSLAYFRP